mgnify:FL=1
MVKKIPLFLLLLFWSCEDEAEPDTVPPTVTIISPNDGSTVSESVTITCISTDNEGVEKVELWVNDVSTVITYESELYSLFWNIISDDDSSYTIIKSKPYSLFWDVTSYNDGTYTIIVRSYDTSANITDSEPITLTLIKTVELWGDSYSIENTTTLSLQDNQLTGEIPPAIGSLTNLTHLYLQDNQLTGEIPPEIGNLTHLTDLYLQGNQLTELSPEIGNLTILSKLYLYSNQLTGEIPPEIGNLTYLTGLLLYDNQLTGTIPTEIGNLTNLEVLYLSDNQLTGEIPESMCNLVDNNCFIFIYNNQLCPPYPSCIEDNVQDQDTSNCP